MTHLEELSATSNYQFQRWSSTLTRPHSSLPSKDAVNDMFKLGIDNRNQAQRPESSSAKRIIQHHVRIPTGSRLSSPPVFNQPNSSPDRSTTLDPFSSTPADSRIYRSIPVRIKSTAITIPVSKNGEEIVFQNFPKQTHEKRKLTHERKRRKQQAQSLAEKYAETETWFQLRRSLAELKRLATTQELVLDPSTSLLNCDGHSFTALKQVIAEQQEDKKAAVFKSESGASSSFGSAVSSRELIRPSITPSQISLTRPRTTRQSTETYPRYIFEPLIVGSKPIHPLLFHGQHNPLSQSRIKPPTIPPSRSRPNSIVTPLPEEKRARLLLSDLSNDENHPATSLTPTPPLEKIEQEISSRKTITPSPTRLRPPSSSQITSTIKLKSQLPRCRSATDMKTSYSTNKHSPRFILIADHEHRIESWYHQYPFILSDDLLTSFQSKQSQQKPLVSAYFIDDQQSSNPHINAKTFLQGKPFHINNDWKKYDLIFISNNIYEEIILHLQTIINLIKSSGENIQIYQITHDEDLKKQIRNVCKQLQQQN